jgi:hypothetical protein
MFGEVSRNFVAARHPFRTRVSVVHKSTSFCHRNHFFVFRNEQAQSTTLGPKLIFGVVSRNFVATRLGAFKARVFATGTISSFFATNMPNPLLWVQNSCLGVVSHNFVVVRHPFRKRVSGCIQSTSFCHRNNFAVFRKETCPLNYFSSKTHVLVGFAQFCCRTSLLGRRRRRHPSLEAFAVLAAPTVTKQRADLPFVSYAAGRRPATRSSHPATASRVEAHV